MPKKTIFLTGATGKIGNILLKELSGEDYHLVVLAYKDDKVDTSNTKIRYIFGDILEPFSYKSALKNVDTVVHMAAITHTNDIKKYYDINASATDDLIKNCKECGVKRFIFISTRAISEKGGHYSKSKLIAEESVRRSSLDWVILRLAEVYGIGGEAGVNMIINNIETLPIIPIVGDGNYKMAPVHISDVIYSIGYVLRNSVISESTYNIAGPESYSFNEFVDKVLKIKKIRKIKVHIPVWMIRLAAYVLSVFPNINLFVIDQVPRFFCDKSDDISLAVKELNFRPTTLEEQLVK